MLGFTYWVHICWLHRRVTKIQEARRRAVPVTNTPDGGVVLGIDTGDGVDSRARTRRDGDTGGVDLELFLVHGEGIRAGQDVVDGPRVAVEGVGCAPVLRVVVGETDDVGVAGFCIRDSNTDGVAALAGRDPTIDLEGSILSAFKVWIRKPEQSPDEKEILDMDVHPYHQTNPNQHFAQTGRCWEFRRR